MLAAVIPLGAHGVVSGGANMFPRLYVALYEAVMAGAQQRVSALHDKVMRISRTIYSMGEDASRHIKGIKCALKWLNVCDDYVAQPFQRFEGESRETIGRAVRELAALVGQTEPTRVAPTGR